MGRKAKAKKAAECEKIRNKTTNKKNICGYDDSVNENTLSTESFKIEYIDEPGDKVNQDEYTELQLPRNTKFVKYKTNDDLDVVNKKKIKIINKESGEVLAKNFTSDEENNVAKPKKIKRNSNYSNVIVNKKIKFDCDSKEIPTKKNDNVKPIGNEEEMNVKDEDIDKYCEELDEESNKQYENWVKLIEANFKSNIKKKLN